MNVWHFCPSPVDIAREQGGVSNVVRALAVEMARIGQPTTVICGDCELGRQIQSTGTVSPMPNLRIVTVRQNGNPALGPVSEIAGIISRIPAGDVAHVHTCFSAFSDYAMHALARRGIPYVFSPHGKFSAAALRNREYVKRLWWSAISRQRINMARRIGANSPGEASDAKKIGLRPPTVTIPNGYSPPAGTRWRTGRPIIPGKYILFLGYLDPRKRPELLIEALSLCTKANDVRLVMAGPDPYSFGDRLKQLAREAGMIERVMFHGPAYGEEKWNLLANALCLCLPSRAEGMPLVLAEAVGAGIPILVSPECNGTGLVADGAGIEVAVPTGAAWAAALDRLLASPDEMTRIKKAASRISPQYQWPAIAARWMEVYRAIAAEQANGDRLAATEATEVA